MKKILFSLSILLAFSSYSQTLDSLRAEFKNDAPPLNSDRPGATYSPLTVGKGALTTQWGLEVGGHEMYKWSIQNSSIKGALDVRYGLGDNLEIGTFLSGVSNNINTSLIESSERKYGSYSVNLRYTLREKENCSLGILADAAYGHDRQENYMTYALKGLYAISLNSVIGLSSNLGYNYSEGQSWGNYTLNLGFALSDDFGFYAEGYGNFGSSNEFWLDGGIWYLIGPNVQLDMLFAKGFNNNIQDIVGSVGVTWRLIDPK